MFLNSIARKVAKTKFGQKTLTKSEEILIFRDKPGLRVYIGISLSGLSFFTGIPAIALLSFLSVKLGEPLIVAIGAPVVIIVVHIMFGLGIYLAGKNYAKDVLYWATKRFLEKHGL